MHLRSNPLSKFTNLIVWDGNEPAAEPPVVVPPAAEPPAGDPPVEPPAEPPAGEPPVVAPVEPVVVPPAGGTNDAASRIRQLTADKWQNARRAEAAEAELTLLRQQNEQFLNAARAAGVQVPTQGQQPPAGNQPQYSAADLQREVANAASEMRYREQCDQLVLDGRKTHGAAFDTALAQLNKYGTVPRHVVEAAMETGLGADVIAALGNDPMEADRILSLPPQRVGVAVERLATGLRAAKGPEANAPVISRAPAPIKPAAGGNGTSKQFDPNDPDAPIEQWMAWRNKGLKAKSA